MKLHKLIELIPYFLKEFANAHPQVELRIDVTNKNSVLNSLSKNETDFSLVSVLPENMAIEGVELMDNELYLISNFILEAIKIKFSYFSKHL